MTLDQLRSENRERILEIAKKHGAHNVRVFGSVARGESGVASDLDLLVDLEPKRTLLDHGKLIAELEQALGCTVDVIPAEDLKEHLRDVVLASAVPL